MGKSAKQVKSVPAVVAPVVAATEVAAPEAPKTVYVYYTVGHKKPNQKNTSGVNHKEQGDVPILNALLAEIAKNGFILHTDAVKLVKTLDNGAYAKNVAVLRYLSVKRGWLARIESEVAPFAQSK